MDMRIDTAGKLASVPVLQQTQHPKLSLQLC
jgi:hypothetical protein